MPCDPVSVDINVDGDLGAINSIVPSQISCTFNLVGPDNWGYAIFGFDCVRGNCIPIFNQGTVVQYVGGAGWVQYDCGAGFCDLEPGQSLFWYGGSSDFYFGSPGNYQFYFYLKGNPSGGVTLTAHAGPLTVNGADLGPCTQCQGQAGAPINVTNGNVWVQQRDYSVPGLGGGLRLARTWNSLFGSAAPPFLAGMFGQSWRSTYEEMLAGPDSNNNLTYWRGDGSAWTFTYNSALNSYSLSSPPDERAQLWPNPAGGFTLTLADGTQRVFNSENLLSAIIDRNSNQTTLAYDSSNRLTSVTSPGGSTLTFTYGDSNNPTQVTTVQDSVGTVATYTYDSSSRLILVSYPDGSALNFTYDPNSSMLLSVTDSQGKLSESHTYDAQRRGLTSSRAYGADSITVSY
jgi:YD repeat-containing protein